jgi:hypothetical protein
VWCHPDEMTCSSAHSKLGRNDSKGARRHRRPNQHACIPRGEARGTSQEGRCHRHPRCTRSLLRGLRGAAARGLRSADPYGSVCPGTRRLGA